MALLFCDGFDHYDDNWETSKWDVASNIEIGTTGGRRNGGWALLTDNDQLKKYIPASGTVILGTAIGDGGYWYSERYFMYFKSNGVNQVYIKTVQNPNMTQKANIKVYNGADSLLGETTTYPLDMTRWNYLQVKVTIDDSSGIVVIKQNDVTLLNLTGVDTKYDTASTVDEVYINGPSSGLMVDDLYICNSAGSINNDFLGDIKVITHRPDVDGTYTDFVPSTGTDHYALVDEALVNTTDYNDGDAVDEMDSYGITVGSNLGTILGVQITSVAQNPDVGTRKIKNFIRSNSTDYLGSTELTLSNTWLMLKEIWEVDPYDSGTWTKTKLDAIEIGVKVTV